MTSTNPPDITIITISPENTVLSKLQTLTRTIEMMRYEQHKLARELPPVRFADLCGDGTNVNRAFEVSVRAWMNTFMSPIDTTLLDREDVEKWEILTPRYVVKGLTDGDETRVGVWDYDEARFVTLEDSDEPVAFDSIDEASDKACDLQYWSSINHGFPFAWNEGWIIDGTYWLAELQAAGFLVYRYDDDCVIAGIDGGGYSFMGAHFAPLYAALAAKNDWLVETDDGPRRITMSRE